MESSEIFQFTIQYQYSGCEIFSEAGRIPKILQCKLWIFKAGERLPNDIWKPN